MPIGGKPKYINIINEQLADNINYITVIASSNIYTLDLQNKAVKNFAIETTDAVAKTIVFSNVDATAGVIHTVSVKLKYTNAATITYPTVVWQNGSAPSFTAGKTYLLLFTKYGNDNWLASSVGAW